MLPFSRRFAGFGLFGLTLLSATAPARAAQDFSTLYGFSVFAGVLSRGNVDGKASDARFSAPEAVACDASGNVYIADGNLIRKISPGGVVSTLNVTPSSALGYPRGLAVDASGNLYLANTGSQTICKITPDGTLTIVAGTAGSFGSADGSGAAARFSNPSGVAMAPSGDLFVADSNNNTIRRISPTGTVTTLAGQAGTSGSADGTGSSARFFSPGAIAVDAAGVLYVADVYNGTIRRITPAGEVTTLAGTAGSGAGNADGLGPAARFTSLRGIAVDVAGNVFVSEETGAIRKITSGGAVSHLAGTGNAIDVGAADGTGSSASFVAPHGLAADAAGNVYVADWLSNTIRKVTPAGVVTTLAGISELNAMWFADGPGATARFRSPDRLVVDSSGNLYVTDGGNHAIRKITPAGVVSTLAGSPDAAGIVDGTGNAARFDQPASIAIDAAGMLYIGEANNSTIRKVTTSGVVSTWVTGLGTFGGLATDGSGNVYAMDSLRGSGIVWKISPAGGRSVLVGGETGPAGDSKGDGSGGDVRFWYPQGIAADAGGNVYVADTGQSTIRRVTPGGVATTVAGTPFAIGTDDGAGSAAKFSSPSGIAVDAAGNLYVAEIQGGIRKISPAATVSTLATSIVRVDNPQAVRLGAMISMPRSVAVDAQGTVYVIQGQAILKGQRANAPVITAQPQSSTVAAGGSVQFSVTASGSPAPTYQWFFNGSPFSDATGSSLSLANVRSSDAGNYTVKVTNALGNVTSATATLTIGSSSGGGSTGGGGGGSGGGGGAPSGWFLTGLAIFGFMRWRRRRC